MGDQEWDTNIDDSFGIEKIADSNFAKDEINSFPNNNNEIIITSDHDVIIKNEETKNEEKNETQATILLGEINDLESREKKEGEQYIPADSSDSDELLNEIINMAQNLTLPDVNIYEVLNSCTPLEDIFF
jgi:hypothetical protein